MRAIPSLLAAGAVSLAPLAALHSAPVETQRPTPTIRDGHYGADPTCTFDFWARGERAPLIVFIHGGGFTGGSKDSLADDTLKYAQAQGFAVMAVNYPFLAREPIQRILPICARAVQYARAHAAEWGIDPGRVYSMGTSAGAGASLWMAAHPDLADAASPDPVARQSTRIQGAAMINGQATYDLYRWAELLPFPFRREWQPDPRENFAFYHLASEEQAKSPAGVAIRQDVDMYGLLTPGTPPLYLYTNTSEAAPLDRGAYLHHPRHAVVLAERAKAVGIPVELRIGRQAMATDGYHGAVDFFRRLLDAKP